MLRIRAFLLFALSAAAIAVTEAGIAGKGINIALLDRLPEVVICIGSVIGSLIMACIAAEQRRFVLAIANVGAMMFSGAIALILMLNSTGFGRPLSESETALLPFVIGLVISVLSYVAFRSVGTTITGKP